MKKYFAEVIGTFILVLFGCGTAVVAGDKVGILGIAFAFGLGLIAAAYGIGPISGCHINPAGKPGSLVAGRMTLKEMLGYWVGQFAGAILAAVVLVVIISGVAAATTCRQRPGAEWLGPRLPGRLQHHSAMVFEFVATLIFVLVILGSTQKNAPVGICRSGHRHHPGGDSHLRHPHYRRQRKPGPQPWPRAVCRRQGACSRSGCFSWCPAWPGLSLGCPSACGYWKFRRCHHGKRKWEPFNRLPRHPPQAVFGQSTRQAVVKGYGFTGC